MTEYRDVGLPVEHFDEPSLEFGHGQLTAHPKDGLFLFGPHQGSRKAKEVRLGVLGTQKGLGYFRSWMEGANKGVSVPPRGPRDKLDRLHLAAFPGFREALGFFVDTSSTSYVAHSIDAKDIDRATSILNLHEAVARTVELYSARAKRHLSEDERAVDLWMLILPEIIFERCRPDSKRKGVALVKGTFGKRQKARSDLPLLGDIVDQESEEIFDDVPDFHRQAKAAFLAISPTQLVRETTVAPEAALNKAGNPARRTQDSATVAWNLATGMYYKTQPHPPWKLASTRPRVCYLGLVFKNLPNDPSGHACCAAQMFLNEGDGVVFRGANGPWRTSEHEFHLKTDAAKDLIQKVLDAYSSTHDGPPNELFIHGQAHFNDEEWDAFVRASPRTTNVVGVRIRQTNGETKLFRDGDYPVLRGTAVILDERNAYLWTTGYVPQLDTYIGPETPNPLFITVLRSKDSMPKIQSVLSDIMGLTKINYNSANFNDGLPVTVRFARLVGDVLVLGSAKGVDRQPFKFYI